MISIAKKKLPLLDDGQEIILLSTKGISAWQNVFNDFLWFLSLKNVPAWWYCTELVEMSVTLHGEELCDGISHLKAGIKIADGKATDL